MWQHLWLVDPQIVYPPCQGTHFHCFSCALPGLLLEVVLYMIVQYDMLWCPFSSIMEEDCWHVHEDRQPWM